MKDLRDTPTIVLCGGRGTRLKRAWQGPKCLAPVAGRPFLDYLLAQLGAANVGLVVLALRHHASAVVQYVKTLRVAPRIVFSVELEDAPEGAATAIRYAMRHVRARQVFIMNGDTFVDADLASLVARAAGPITAYFDSQTQAHTGLYVIDARAARALQDGTALLPLAKAVRLPLPFSDIGTPEALRRAQGRFKMRATEDCQ